MSVKKIVLSSVVLLVAAMSFAQKEKDLTLNEETSLIEATYYHENGQISQEGTFDLAGKLHGKWISYNKDGEKISIGSYEKGVKTGKWVFYDNGVMKEVEFSNNIIASVVKKDSKTGVVTKD